MDPPSELAKLVDEGEPVELACNFCSKKYTFSPDEMRELLAEMSRGEIEGCETV